MQSSKAEERAEFREAEFRPNMRKGPENEAQDACCEIELSSALPTPEEDRI